MIIHYMPVGYAERVPDFWEISKKNGENLNKEKNSQIDLGINYQTNKLQTNIAGYVSHIQDYIMLDYRNQSTSSLNTNSLLFGGEVEVSYEFLANTYALLQLSYTYGEDIK